MNTTKDEHRELNQAIKAIRLDIRKKRTLSRYRRRLNVTNHTLEDLQAIARSEPRTTESPARLPVERIKIAEQVFQHRLPGSDQMSTEAHLRSITNAINGFLKGVPGKMAPILVMAVGSSFYCVDGHHRLEAYRRSKWTKLIPVRVFTGTIEEGQDQALRVNQTSKLALSTTSRSEAAWKLVKRGTLSKAAIAELSGRSPRLVASMRARLKENPQYRNETWADVLYGFTRSNAQIDSAGRDAKAVTKLATKLTKMGVKFPAPNILARALAALSEDLPAQLVRCWPEAARSVVKHLDDPHRIDNLLGI